MALTYPSLLPGVFAAGAVNHEDIPDTDADTGRMAWDVGFPAETSQPLASGGVPPRRLDMNGLGNRLSQHIMWQQSGGLYIWSATLDYPVGAHILGSDGVEYIAIAASGPSSGGAVNPTTDINNTKWKSLQRYFVDVFYPVGSIYMSVNNANPATLFGGIWQQIQGRFLLGSSGSIAAGSTGGARTHTLTVSEMPSHTHTANAANDTHHHSFSTLAQTITVNTGTAGSHTHDVTFAKKVVDTTTEGSHTHSRGTMDITGSFFGGAVNNNVNYTFTGAFKRENSSLVYGGITETAHDGKITTFKASDGWTGSFANNGSHKHSVTVPKTVMTSESDGSHRHSVSVTVPAQTRNTANDTHTHTLTVDNTGGGAAFSIMPPYFAVNVWQRTE